MASDNFDAYSDDSNLGDAANWTTLVNDMLVQNPSGDGQIHVGAGNNALIGYTGASFADNQYAQGVYAVAHGDYVGVAVRTGDAAGGGDGYLYTGSNGDRFLERWDNGSGTTLASASANNWTTNDVIYLEADGTTITPKINGSADPNISGQTDATYGSGDAGVGGYGFGDEVNGNLDGWEAGDLGGAAEDYTVSVIMHHRRLIGAS